MADQSICIVQRTRLKLEICRIDNNTPGVVVQCAAPQIDVQISAPGLLNASLMVV